MATVVGTVNTIEGIFYAQDENGNIRVLKAGDEIYQGDIVFGDEDNSSSDLLEVSTNQAEIINLKGENSLVFDMSTNEATFGTEETAFVANSDWLSANKDISEEETKEGEEQKEGSAENLDEFLARDGNMTDVESGLYSRLFTASQTQDSGEALNVDLSQISDDSGVFEHATRDNAFTDIKTDLNDNGFNGTTPPTQNNENDNIENVQTEQEEVQTQPPSATITINTVATDDVLNATESAGNVTVSGTVGGDAQSGDTVTITVNGQDYTTTVQGDLTYSVDVAGSDLVADPSIDAKVTGTDENGNSFEGTNVKDVTVDVTSPIIVDSSVTLEEAHLSDGSEAKTEGATYSKSFTITEVGELSSITIEGQEIGVDGAFSGTISQNGFTISHIEVSKNEDGTYSVKYNITLDENKDHSTSNELNFDLDITATDVAGNTDSGKLSIVIEDDGVTANSDTNTIVEDSSILTVSEGNGLLSNDISVDGNLTVTNVSLDGWTSSTDENGIITLTNPEKGTLTVNPDGSYSFDYTDQSLTNGESEDFVFSYTVKDGDGSESSSSLTITANGSNDAVSLTTTNTTHTTYDAMVGGVTASGKQPTSTATATQEGSFSVNGDDIQSITINGVDITTEDLDTLVIYGTYGEISNIEYNEATGEVTYTYTQTQTFDHDNAINSDGSEKDDMDMTEGWQSDFLYNQDTTFGDSFEIVVTDKDGETANGKITTTIIDDAITLSNDNSGDGYDVADSTGTYNVPLDAKGDALVNGKLTIGGADGLASLELVKTGEYHGTVSHESTVMVGSTPKVLTLVFVGNQIFAVEGEYIDKENGIFDISDPYYTFTLDAAEGTWTFEQLKEFTGKVNVIVQATDNDGDLIQHEIFFEGNSDFKEASPMSLVDQDAITTSDLNDTIQYLDGHGKINISGNGLQYSENYSAGLTVDAAAGNDDVYLGEHNDTIFLGESDSSSYDTNDEALNQNAQNALNTFMSGDDSSIVQDANNEDSALIQQISELSNSGVDIAHSGGGDDTIHGESGTDLIFGGSGDDTIYGGEGNDGLRGGSGNDTIDGGSGADSIYGGSGDDLIIADTTDTFIDGGSGYDTLALMGSTDINSEDINISDFIGKIKNIEELDLSADGGHLIDGLSLEDVLAMRESNDFIDIDVEHLKISGTAEDTVHLTDQWTKGATDSEGYTSYTGVCEDETIMIKIHESINTDIGM